MNNLMHLEEVMATQAELTEQLIEVMKQQQSALVNIDSTKVEQTVDRQQELLMPIEGLEQERVRLTKEVVHSVAPHRVANEPIPLTTLLMCLDGEEAIRLSRVGSRLHLAVETMMKMNQANQYLIDHSRKFVRETFRIVTDGYSRKLVDQKI
jgi:flagellar biosynthesis/type III secretory pathway chaperone